MKRAYNFNAGPSTLPLSVLEEAKEELLDYQGTGMSIVEISHRSKEYEAVQHEAINLSKELFCVPPEFDALFIQGGATLQFSMVPMNFLKEGKKAAYVISGSWSKKAFSDARMYGAAYSAWDGMEWNYTRMPCSSEIKIEADTSYLHITGNETIEGTRFYEWPEVGIPIIADLSSEYMSRPIPWEKFDLVYGGVQKNLAPSGMALVFIRKSVIPNLNQNFGTYFKYGAHAKESSLYNTPPTFSIYIMGKVLKWMKRQGGLTEINRIAEDKAKMVYDAIDNSNNYYKSPVEKKSRSIMNIVFRLPNETLGEKFLKEAQKLNLIGLKGHRSVGGCRVSSYNAMPIDGIRTLIDFMEEFRKSNSA